MRDAEQTVNSFFPTNNASKTTRVMKYLITTTSLVLRVLY
jgi:hypothetical protein